MVFTARSQVAFDQRERNPEIGPGEENLSLREDANNAETFRINADLPADHRGGSGEFPAPERFAEERDVIAVVVLFGVEYAAGERLDAHRWE